MERAGTVSSRGLKRAESPVTDTTTIYYAHYYSRFLPELQGISKKK
mgnify:CR=1